LHSKSFIPRCSTGLTLLHGDPYALVLDNIMHSIHMYEITQNRVENVFFYNIDTQEPKYFDTVGGDGVVGAAEEELVAGA